MAEKYLSEAFQALSILNEDTFEVSPEGIAELKQFVDDDSVEEVEEIIDPLAETEEDLKDSYLGKAILDCVICQSKIYKDPVEVTINEEEDLANVGEVCPYCQSSDGFKVIGQVAEYHPESETEVKTDEEDVDIDIEETSEEKVESDDEEFEEALKSKRGMKKLKDMKEDLNNVQIETDKERITVTAEPKEETPAEGEMIAPVSAEVESEFKTEEPEAEEIEFDEFSEDDFDELGEKYLRKVYENVKSYKTTSGSTKGNLLKLEGIITFKSGKRAKTNFVFEAKTVTKTGKLKFIGENKQFAKGKQTFTLTGRANGSKLIAESLTYNYRAKDAKTGASKKLYGTVTKSR